MDIELRIRQLLLANGLQAGHGIVTRMERDLAKKKVKTNRHKLAALLNNQTDHFSLSLLAAVCEWLVDQGVPEDQLPRSLFGRTELWERIVDSQRVRIYLGAQTIGSVPRRWISLRDAAVSSDISTALTASGKTPQIVTHYVPIGNQTDSQETFKQIRSNCACTTDLIIGSQRVNFILEHFVATCFERAGAFESQGEEPLVPFYQMYRPNDGDVPSCFGGETPPPGADGRCEPGTYYLRKRDGEVEWVGEPWVEGKLDAGVVIVSWDPIRIAIEVAIFGFSGPATNAVGYHFLKHGEEYWPPVATCGNRQLGVFICHIDFSACEDSDSVTVDPAVVCKVTPMSGEVLERFTVPSVRKGRKKQTKASLAQVG